MSAYNYYPPPPPAQPQKQGLAIASLVVGIASFLCFGLALIGTITGVILGTVALKRANSNPQVYGGKGIAIAGIITSACSVLTVFFGIIVMGISVPNLIKSRQAANEASAIGSLRNIGTAEATYQSTEGHSGHYTDLKTLGQEGLIDGTLASGIKNGYSFAATPATAPDGTEMFDATAIPQTTGNFGTGTRSFACNETFVIYQAPGATELRGTATDRAPLGGAAIQ